VSVYLGVLCALEDDFPGLGVDVNLKAADRIIAHRGPQGLPSHRFMCRLMCAEPHMATNLSLDPDLIERALEVSGERTKKAAVTRALEEFIARRRQKRLVELMGKLEWDEGFDYKAERSRR